MDLRNALLSQYRAALRMHRSAIEECPDSLWADETPRNRFWNLSYHALFYTHLYASESEELFEPWEKARPNCHYMGRLPYPPHTAFELGPPYTQDHMLEYVALVEQSLLHSLPKEDLSAASGFEWIPFDRLELHLYNLRHLQHHTGQLIDRLSSVTEAGVQWVGRVLPAA